MFKITKISRCDVDICSYNDAKNCHTMAITVGDGSCAMCDTFMKADMKGGDINIMGSVGACKTSECKFNKSLECTAGQISVGMHSGHADCMTFLST